MPIPPALSCPRRWVAFGLFASLLHFQGLPAAAQEEKNPSALFRGHVGAPIPNASLPRHIPAPQGVLTLFADYPAAGQLGIPLYLVNRTSSAVSFPAQDGDIYLKLERF